MQKFSVLIVLNIFSLHNGAELEMKDFRKTLLDIKSSYDAQIRDLQEHISSQQEQLSKLESSYEMQLLELNQKLELQKESSASVAFSSRVTSTVTVNSSPVKFDTVDLNNGGAYDPFTGLFTPQVEGTYLFTLYATAPDGGSTGPIYIRRNTQNICRTFINDDGDTTNGCTAITYLAPGDTVSVVGDSSNTARIKGADSGFVGHIIVG